MLLSISVLGPLVVTRDGSAVAAFGYNKVRGLLVYLAVEAGPLTRHTRAQLCALLWPEQPEQAARRNLRQALNWLRRALEVDETGAPGSGQPLLLSSSDDVQLHPDLAVQVDALEFARLLEACERHAHRAWHTCAGCAGRLQAALRLYRGDFLAGFALPDSAPFEEWALLWRERLRQRALSALQRLAAWAEWRGAFGQAAAHARRQAELDPLNEAGQREAVRLLALNGEPAAALAQYAELQRVLAAELGLAPEAESVALRNRVRAAAGGDPGALDGLRRLRAPPLDAPRPPNPLIGRAEALATVVERLRDERVRALTVTGTPGVGKTRLALEAAAELRYDFEHGVQVVELAPVAKAEGVPLAVAQALEVKERPGKPLAVSLTAHLKSKHSLLVLDNFEHVLEAAGLVAELLAACPGVKVLATSRSPLHIRAEQQYELSPLARPQAVELFVDRAQAVRAGFALTAENSAPIEETCSRLDGLPLAIELIAVRARLLSPADLLQELDRRLAVLVAGPRDLPERQRTLRSAIAWSYDRLNAQEQLVFRCLGVFAGGGTLEGAQAVLAESLPGLALLEALHDASLVQTQPDEDGMRFTWLETLREFALEQLAQRGEAEGARRRHAEYFLALAERAEEEFYGPRQKAWFDRVDHELANLNAALAWSEAHAPETGLRLGTALVDYWRVRGQMQAGQRWLAQALLRCEGAEPEVRARGLLAAGRLARMQGSHREARAQLTQAQQLLLHTEDSRGLAMAHFNLGMATMGLAEHAAAQAHFEQSLSLAREVEDWHTEAAALNGLGILAARLGDYPRSRVLTEQSLALHEAKQDWRNIAGLKLNLGLNAHDEGDHAAALRYLQASLAVARELDDRDMIALALLGLGNAFLAQGNLAQARACLEETITTQRARGETAPAALSTLGRVAHQAGEFAAARSHFTEALLLRLQGGEAHGLARSLENLARLEHSEQRTDRAARLVAASASIREAIGAPITPATRAEQEQFVAALRATLGQAAFEQAWAAGRALTPEAAVALALED